jgi:transposase
MKPSHPTGGMAYVRRKFIELHKANQSPVEGGALQRITRLYEIEIRGCGLASRAPQLTRTLGAAKATGLQGWLHRMRDTVADGGGLARTMD